MSKLVQFYSRYLDGTLVTKKQRPPRLGQQFQIQNLMSLKALHKEDFTIFDNLLDR